MKIMVCLDDRDGMTFGGRRLSRDREVIRDVLETVGEGSLFLNSYSSSLFADASVTLTVAEDFLDRAGAEEWCFVENLSLSPYRDRICEMVIYHWNRHYPSDRKLDVSPLDLGMSLQETVEFAGYSHEKITKETYRK